jgi:LDH2 family malate/lactate/ureidoglycolate dehydrogenase
MTTTVAAETIPASRLHSLALGVLERVGMSPEDATAAADAMVWAEMRDLPMHGVSGKLAQCVRRIKSGVTAASVDFTPARETPSSIVLDAKNAWGQVVGTRAMSAAIAKARAQGVGVAIVRNSSSAAAMGYYTTLAIAERVVGIAITNGPPLMPPPGGTTRVVGNQGFALGAPASRHAPLIFDSALSRISTGEIHTAQERGLPLADGLMLDAQGRPTSDPVAALAGLYVPIGGHKGFGLALMWEVLTGVLSGGALFGPEVGAPDVFDRRQGVSHFFLALDPTVSMPYEIFVDRVDRLIDDVHASPPASGASEILVPGERGHRISEERRRDGVPIAAKRLAALRALADEVGVTW